MPLGLGPLSSKPLSTLINVPIAPPWIWVEDGADLIIQQLHTLALHPAYRLSFDDPFIDLYTAPTPGGPFYFVNEAAVGSVQPYGALQDQGTPPGVQTTVTGWLLGAVAAGNYSTVLFGTTRNPGTFGTTPLPAGAPTAVLGNSFRTQQSLLGVYNAGNWTIAIAVRSNNAVNVGQGNFRLRIWASPDPSGQIGIRELTTSTLSLSTAVLGLSQSNTTVVWAAPDIELVGEYLFFEMAWAITVAEVSTGRDAVIVIDPVNSIVTPPAFSPGSPAPMVDNVFPDRIPPPPSLPVQAQQFESFVEVYTTEPGFGPFWPVDQPVDNATTDGRAQDGGNAPATRPMYGAGKSAQSGAFSTGWTTGAVVAGDYARVIYGSTRATGGFTATVQPSGVPNLTDSFRTEKPITGYYPSGSWSMAIAVFALTVAGSPQGNLRMRVWASTDPTGATNIRELTSSPIVFTTATLASNTQSNTTATWAAPLVSLSGEHLFFQLAWQITQAGTGAGNIVLLAQDATNTIITPTSFVPVETSASWDTDYPDVVRGFPVTAHLQPFEVEGPRLTPPTVILLPTEDYPTLLLDTRVRTHLFAEDIAPRPERTAPTFSDEYPEAARGKYLLTAAQPFTADDVPPRPERTSTEAVQVFPDTVPGMLPRQQLADAARNDAPEEQIVRAEISFPDVVPGALPRAHEDVSAHNLAPERTATLAEQNYPSAVPGRAVTVQEQPYVASAPLAPERTSTLWSVDYPPQVLPPLPRAPIFVGIFNPAPERTAPLSLQEYPAQILPPLPREPMPVASLPVYPERRTPEAVQVFPDTVPGPLPRQQMAVDAANVRPERKATFASEQDFPSTVLGRSFPTHMQSYALSEPPRPERAVPLFPTDYPGPRDLIGPAPRQQLYAFHLEFGNIPPPTIGGPFYLLDAVASSSSNGSLQDGGFPPGAGDTGTGWTKPNSGHNSQQTVYGTVTNVDGFGLEVAIPNGSNCWRSQLPLSGYWRGGTWTFAISVHVINAGGGGGVETIHMQLWASSDPTGVGARPLTTLTATTPTDVSLAQYGVSPAGVFSVTGSTVMPSVGIEGEYLFVHLGNTTNSIFQKVVIRQDAANSVVTPPAFVRTDVSDVAPYVTLSYPDVVRGRTLHPAYMQDHSDLTNLVIAVVPTQAPDTYPEAVRALVVRPLGFMLDVAPEPERSSPYAAQDYPSSVLGPLPRAQMPVASMDLKPERSTTLSDQRYPDQVLGRPLPTYEQPYALDVPPKPERAEPYFDQAFSDLVPGPLPRHQMYVGELDPHPERAEPYFDQVYAERLDRRVTRQDFFVEVYMPPRIPASPVDYPSYVPAPLAVSLTWDAFTWLDINPLPPPPPPPRTPFPTLPLTARPGPAAPTIRATAPTDAWNLVHPKVLPPPAPSGLLQIKIVVLPSAPVSSQPVVPVVIKKPR